MPSHLNPRAPPLAFYGRREGHSKGRELFAYTSSRAIIAVAPDLGYERDRSINQQRERLGSKTTLCSQFLEALKDTVRPASSWSANCRGRHHLRRLYSSGSPISLSAASTRR